MSERGELGCLRALIRASALPAWIADAEGRLIEANAAFCALVGLEAHQLTDAYSFSEDPSLEAQGLAGRVRGALHAGRGVTFLYRFDSRALGLQRAPLRFATLHIIVSPLSDESGRFEHALVQVIDVTEERRALEDLRETRERFELVLQGSQDGLWDWDLNTNEVHYSARWKAMLGYAPEEIKDHLDAWSRLIHPEDVGEAWAHFHEYMSGAVARFKIEFRMRHKAGHWVPILSRAFKRLGADGAPARLVGTHVDLSALKAAEAALKREVDLVQSIIEHMGEGLALASIVDARPWVRFSVWNQKMVDLTGYTLEEINAEGWFEALHPDAERRADALARFRIENQGQRLKAEPWLLTRKDGQQRTISLTTSRLPSGEVLTLAHDLTEQLAKEVERREWERRTLESQKLESLGVLAGGVAHDFNNILMVAMGNLQMARVDIAAEDETQELLEEAERALERAANLTQQMLAYSGRGRFVVGPVDLSALIEEMRHLLASAIPKQVSLRVELDAALPLIEADAVQLQQVLMNLVINAAESYEGSPARGVVVRTYAIHCDEARLHRSLLLPGRLAPARPGEHVVLEVEDEGCGMSPEVQARIFEPFFTTKFTGRGLGMSAVQGIVRGHRGLIELRSAEGAGTRWRVMLPAHDTIKACTQAGEGEAPRGSGRVLVVDDEPGVRALVSQMLSQLGYTPLSARDGWEALRCVQDAPVVCVLLDFSMPGMDGVETLRELRQSDPRVRVILTSGYGEGDARLAEGAPLRAGFLMKPFGLNALGAALREAMQAQLTPQPSSPGGE